MHSGKTAHCGEPECDLDTLEYDLDTREYDLDTFFYQFLYMNGECYEL